MSNKINVTGDKNVIVTDSNVILNHQPDIFNKITELRTEIRKFVSSPEEQRSSYEIIDVIERELKSESPKTSVLGALIESLPSVGSIASIGSFLLAAISS